MKAAPSGLALTLQQLALSYPAPEGRRQILNIEHFNVSAGASVALLGPSGSGKSSLLNLLCGIALPDHGAVLWHTPEHAAVDLPTLSGAQRDRWRRQHLGIVFQQFHLFPRMSPLENVLLPARFDALRLPASLAAQARALLARVGVPAAHDISTLSRGELQRVALARALLRQPAVLIADEPTASLDPATADSIGDLILDLCRERGTTALVATHDTRFAAKLDHAYRLESGQLVPQEHA